jgi:1-deoxy-D-xylulose-5-phosphate reductoisomerase
MSADEIEHVTIKDALNHPNWSMGDKITIDSATMMNKALEVIEASYLFDLPPKKIEVLVHPQSIIHSLVEYEDGSSLTQLGCPDMRVPISFALGYPDRIKSGVDGVHLDLCENLSFSKPRHQIFPCLNLAYEVLEQGQAHIIALNAANEIAVDAFLNKKIKFMQIYSLVRKVLDTFRPSDVTDISTILQLDHSVREHTKTTLLDI